jgi:hypothetical protein
MDKAKGIVEKIEKKTSAAGKEYYFATIGAVRFLFFDQKIAEYEGKEVEIEYEIKTDAKGTTYWGRFPGAAKPAGTAAGIRRGMSPEELKQKAIQIKITAKTMCFSYAKDLVIAKLAANPDELPPSTEQITKELDAYIKFMLGLLVGNMKELEG